MRERLLHNPRINSLRLIPTGFVSQDMMLTSDLLYDEGRSTQGGKIHLEEAAIWFFNVDPKTGLYLFPKRTPYITEPGLDNMLYFAEDGKPYSSLGNVEIGHLQTAFQILESVQAAYCEIAPIQRHVISINHHSNPISDRNIFGKKVNAQSLDALHFHAFSFTESELGQTSELSIGKLKKRTKDYLIDPASAFISGLMREPSIQRMLLKDIRSFHMVDDGKYEGILIDIGQQKLTSDVFCQDLQQLHRNANDLYYELTGLFVNSDSRDGKLMPVKLDDLEITKRINQFLDGHPITDETLRRGLHRIGKILKNAEDQNYPEDRVFLRGLAYVLYLVREAESVNKLYFSPKLFSAGNAISALGFLCKNDFQHDQDWIKLRDDRQKQIGITLGRMIV